MTTDTTPQPLSLAPDYRPRVWGGTRLHRATPPIGELWAIHAGSRVVGGRWDGRTLHDVAVADGAALLGGAGGRFPLLIKLLDTADWLSVQVHPDDDQARALEGPDGVGKAEAWHLIEAADDAELIAGVLPGTTQAALTGAIAAGSVMALLERHRARAGETYMLPPGAVHALGPGLLLYEVQQPSDITYRVFDWNRPATEGRALHIAQAQAVSRADRAVVPLAALAPHASGRTALLRTEWFDLDLLRAASAALPLDTRTASLHALTTIAGTATLRGVGWQRDLPRLSSLLVPAGCGAYELLGRDGPCSVLMATPGGAADVR